MNPKKILLAFYLLTSFNLLSAQNGPITIGAGKFNDAIMTSSSASNGTSVTNIVQDNGFLPNLTAISRFLTQSTLGANYDLIAAVSEQGEAAWLEAEFAKTPAFSLEEHVHFLNGWAADSLLTIGGDISFLEPQLYYWHFAWWQYTMTSPDLLRQRVALALSEIFVISELPQLGRSKLLFINNLTIKQF